MKAAQAVRSDTSRTRLWLAAIVAVAVAVRVAHVLLMRRSPGFEQLSMDPLYHAEWARAVARGEAFQPGPFFRAPLYPWFLALGFKLFGESLLAVRLVQCALGGAAAALTYAVGRRAFDARAGLVAAALVATNWVLVYFDGELLIATLIVPLNLLALALSLDLAEQPTPKRALGAGLVWGLTCIARPNPLLFMPFLALWLFWRARARAGSARALGACLALTLGVALPILPITAYNGAQGDRVLISSQAGVNFWIGNNPESDGSSAIVPGTRADWWGGYYDSIAQAEASAGRALRPSEVSAHYARRARAWIAAEPAAALRLFGRKLRYLVSDWELGNNQDERFFARRFGAARYLPPTFGHGGFGLLLGLAAVGLAAGGRDGRSRFPLWGFLLVYALGIAAFFVCSRFRAPLLPVLAVFAGRALVLGWDALRAGRPWAVLGGAACAALVAFGSATLPSEIETSDANGLLQLSVLEAQRGSRAEALGFAREAVAADPDNRIALRQLGVLLAQAGRPGEALAPLREALRLGPRDADSALALSSAARAAGALDEARQAAALAAEIAPNHPGGPLELGRIEFTAEGFESAAAHFARALERDPGSFDAAYSRALALARAGREEQALEAWLTAVALRARGEPEFVDNAYRALIDSLRRAGRAADAARVESEWRARS